MSHCPHVPPVPGVVRFQARNLASWLLQCAPLITVAAQPGMGCSIGALVRTQTLYVCRACGGEAVKWQGQCTHCKEWDSLEAVTAIRGVRQLPGTAAAAGALDDS